MQCFFLHLSVIQEKNLIAKSIKTWNWMLDYKLIVTVRQFLCTVGMRSSKTRDQPQIVSIFFQLFSRIFT